MGVNSKCGVQSKRTHRQYYSSNTLTYDSSVTIWLNPTTEQDVSATVTITHKLQAKRFHWVRHTHAVIDPVCVRVRRAGAAHHRPRNKRLKQFLIGDAAEGRRAVSPRSYGAVGFFSKHSRNFVCAMSGTWGQSMHHGKPLARRRSFGWGTGSLCVKFWGLMEFCFVGCLICTTVWSFVDCLVEIWTTVCVKFCICEVLWSFVRLSAWCFVDCLMEFCTTVWKLCATISFLMEFCTVFENCVQCLMKFCNTGWENCVQCLMKFCNTGWENCVQCLMACVREVLWTLWCDRVRPSARSFVDCWRFVRLSVWSFVGCLMEICSTICVMFCGLFDGDLYDYLCEVLSAVWWRLVRISVWSFVGCLVEICPTICVKFCGLFDGDLYDYLCEVLWAVWWRFV